MTSIFKTTIAAVLAAMTVTLSAASASADLPRWIRFVPAGLDICEDVTIEVTNIGDEPVLVYDIDYYDSAAGRWRSEPTRNFVLAPGESTSVTRNLESVENAETRVGINFRDPDDEITFTYSPQSWLSESEDFICRQDSSVSVPVALE